MFECYPLGDDETLEIGNEEDNKDGTKEEEYKYYDSKIEFHNSIGK